MVLIKNAKPDKPIRWVDDNKLTDEMSEKEFQEKVNEEAKIRDFKKYGRDGIMVIWQRKFTYRKLKFLVKVLRYYVLGVPISEMRGMNKLGKWAVLEYPEEMKIYADFIERELDKCEFLWQDTLHTWNDNQTLKEMVNDMINGGKRDIDWWLDKAEDQFIVKTSEVSKEFKALRGDKNGRTKTGTKR